MLQLWCELQEKISDQSSLLRTQIYDSKYSNRYQTKQPNRSFYSHGNGESKGHQYSSINSDWKLDQARKCKNSPQCSLLPIVTSPMRSPQSSESHISCSCSVSDENRAPKTARRRSRTSENRSPLNRSPHRNPEDRGTTTSLQSSESDKSSHVQHSSYNICCKPWCSPKYVLMYPGVGGFSRYTSDSGSSNRSPDWGISPKIYRSIPSFVQMPSYSCQQCGGALKCQTCNKTKEKPEKEIEYVCKHKKEKEKGKAKKAKEAYYCSDSPSDKDSDRDEKYDDACMWRNKRSSHISRKREKSLDAYTCQAKLAYNLRDDSENRIPRGRKRSRDPVVPDSKNDFEERCCMCSAPIHKQSKNGCKPKPKVKSGQSDKACSYTPSINNICKRDCVIESDDETDVDRDGNQVNQCFMCGIDIKGKSRKDERRDCPCTCICDSCDAISDIEPMRMCMCGEKKESIDEETQTIKKKKKKKKKKSKMTKPEDFRCMPCTNHIEMVCPKLFCKPSCPCVKRLSCCRMSNTRSCCSRSSFC